MQIFAGFNDMDGQRPSCDYLNISELNVSVRFVKKAVGGGGVERGRRENRDTHCKLHNSTYACDIGTSALYPWPKLSLGRVDTAANALANGMTVNLSPQ